MSLLIIYICIYGKLISISKCIKRFEIRTKGSNAQLQFVAIIVEKCFKLNGMACHSTMGRVGMKKYRYCDIVKTIPMYWNILLGMTPTCDSFCCCQLLGPEIARRSSPMFSFVRHA